jgi:hypothetical protein
MIQKVDPYLSQYVWEKSVNPDAPIVWRQYQREVVEDVDRLVELAHDKTGHRENVASQKDWEVVEELINFFAKKWPKEYWEFRKSIPDIRSSRRDGGYSEHKLMMYVAALPPRLERLIKAIFPAQQFNKQFTWKLIRKFPLLKVGGA